MIIGYVFVYVQICQFTWGAGHLVTHTQVKLHRVHVMKTYGQVTVGLLSFITLAVGGNEWSALGIGRFTPRERTRGTDLTGDCVGPRYSLDALEKREVSCACRNSNQDASDIRPIRGLLLYHLSYPQYYEWKHVGNC